MSTTADVAGAARAVAALVEAGVGPVEALRLVAGSVAEPVRSLIEHTVEAAPRQGVAHAALTTAAASRHRRQRFARNHAVDHVRAVEAWAALAVVWGVAEQAGAPLAEALRAFSGMLDRIDRARLEAEVVSAGPAGTARVLQMLPLLGLGLSLMMGVDALGVLLGTPFGWGCLIVGAGLTVTGARWHRRMLRGLTQTDRSDGLLLLCVGLGVQAGRDPVSACADTDHWLTRIGAHDDRAEERRRLQRLIALWRRSGVPLLDLLRAQLAELAQARQAQLRVRAARLESRLLLPLGLCSLPAFVVVAILPMIASILFSTLAGLA